MGLDRAANASHLGQGKTPKAATPAIDAFACNEVRLLIACLAYEVMHIARRAMARATGTGWSLRRLRERVLRAGAQLVISGRRMVMALSSAAAPFWPLLLALHWAEVRSLAGAVLHAPVAGRLAGPFAAQGAQVERGTVLARIMPPGQAARLDADTHRLALARETLARTQVLSRSHAVSVAQLQDAASRVATAADALSAARAAATAATLTPPVSGTVHYMLPSGTEVGSGTAILFVNGTGRVWIRGYVSVFRLICAVMVSS